ncbi:hypothetical protein [Clostridium sp. LIBA-8841]|uniref:hypothetical protein n=1 Tax=Clostridium sp. LIBA-8841 TaxID=2987530 RepID=UPI002AC70AAA|nr:hypothetical protein [Clostridium sp. LIBA-8841]MDZ5253630.1 hypothetical protein [Clostridium sp. LIBA-8841]
MNFLNKLRSINETLKLVIIYIFLYASSLVVGFKVDNKYTPMTENAHVILIINTILFIGLVKIFSVKFKKVRNFIIGLMAFFIVFIIDKDYFLSWFYQSTPNDSILSFITYPLNIILLPFVGMFEVLYNFGLFDFSFIIVPMYFLFLIFVMKKICKD